MTGDFPYAMTEEQRTTFVEALQNLKAGETYENVRKALGNPFDEVIIQGKKVNDPVRGFAVTYYMRKNDRDLVNEQKDEYVVLVFNNDKKLVRMRTNVLSLSLPLREATGVERAKP